MQAFNQHLIKLVSKGAIELNTALAYANSLVKLNVLLLFLARG